MTDPRDPAVTGAITTPDGGTAEPIPAVDVTPDQDGGRSTPDLTDASTPDPGEAVTDRSADRAPWGALHRRAESVSLRARLVLILVSLVVAALALSGALVVNVLHSILLRDLDADLQRAARPVAEAAVNGGFSNRGGPFPSDFVAYPVWTDGTSDSVRRPTFSSSLPTADPDFSPALAHPPGVGDPFTVGSTSGSTRWRVVGLRMTQGDAVVGTVYVATPLTRVDGTIGSLTFALAAVALVVVALGGLLGWMLIRRSFRPLVQVEETAAAIAAGDLSRRIPARPATTEVGRLTTSLNGMLTQIESAFRAREASEARTRRFAADASHELRTPLVSIRGFAELFRQGAVPPDEVPRTMRRIEDEAKRMGSLVEDLLLLARLDEQRPGRKEPVDLTVLAGDAVHDARGLDADRSVRLTGLDDAGPAPAIVTGDEDRLRQVVANLVANAIRHTPAGTPIEVGIGIVGDPRNGGRHAVLEVRDHGLGLAPEQAERVFERFYRVDASRRRGAGGGSGLGLSIVSAVVAAHAGTVEVVPTPGGGATFRVTVPARTEPSLALPQVNEGSDASAPILPGSGG